MFSTLLKNISGDRNDGWGGAELRRGGTTANVACGADQRTAELPGCGGAGGGAAWDGARRAELAALSLRFRPCRIFRIVKRRDKSEELGFPQVGLGYAKLRCDFPCASTSGRRWTLFMVLYNCWSQSC